jgi:zinc/manganese transport system ATP-binding protein
LHLLGLSLKHDPGLLICHALQWGHAGVPLGGALEYEFVPGSVTAITGCNGSGKSTLLKTLAGLRSPVSGEVVVAPDSRRYVGYLDQNHGLDRHFPCRVIDVVAGGLWHVKCARRERKLRIENALCQWHMQGRELDPLVHLSGGELQRTLLARLSVMDAAVLLMDEPTSALDVASRALFWQHVLKWKKEGKTQIIVCHDEAEVRRHCDHEICLTTGKPCVTEWNSARDPDDRVETEKEFWHVRPAH